MLTEKMRSQVLGGCMKDFKTYMAGYCDGFFVIIAFSNGRYEIKVSAWSREDADGLRLADFLAQQKAQNGQILEIRQYPRYFTISMKVPSLARNIPEAINSTLGPVLRYLQDFHYLSGCELCGTPENVGCYEINGSGFHLCETCLQETASSLQKQQQETVSRKSSLTGSLTGGLTGAFLGSLIGCVLWVLIYRLGYIAGIAGAVTGVCAMKGYEKLGGALDKKGVLGSVVIMAVTIYFANRLAWAWEAWDALSSYGYTFSGCFRGLLDILSLSDLTSRYYGDLAIGYVLTLLCSFQSIRRAFQESTGKFTINRRL